MPGTSSSCWLRSRSARELLNELGEAPASVLVEVAAELGLNAAWMDRGGANSALLMAPIELDPTHSNFTIRSKSKQFI